MYIFIYTYIDMYLHIDMYLYMDTYLYTLVIIIVIYDKTSELRVVAMDPISIPSSKPGAAGSRAQVTVKDFVASLRKQGNWLGILEISQKKLQRLGEKLFDLLCIYIYVYNYIYICIYIYIHPAF